LLIFNKICEIVYAESEIDKTNGTLILAFFLSRRLSSSIGRILKTILG